ncbi:MAG TPA: ATP-binding protein [Candidatus Hydrogenedentes bacterium]|nr:ATP-binding protein [Candidatus Hydrogenedentota bacterium]
MVDSSRTTSSRGAASAPSPKRQCRRLGDMLVGEGVISQGQLDEAAARKDELGGFIGKALIDLGYLRQDTLIEFLVKQCKIPHIRLLEYEIGGDLLEFVPPEVCCEFNLVPIDKLGRILTVAMVDPLDVDALERVSSLCPDLRIKPILCSWQDFEMVATRLFGAKPKAKPASAESLGLTAKKKTGPEKKTPTKGAPKEEETGTPERTPAAREPESRAPAGRPGEPSTSQTDLSAEARAAPRETVRDPQSVRDAQLTELADAVRQAAQAASAALRLAFEARGGTAPADSAEGEAQLRKHASVASLESSAAGVALEADERILAALHSESPLEGFTFETFYVDKANSFTYEISKALGKGPGADYNPFFLYGDVGVGKTHLINAIGNAVLSGTAERRVGYVSSSLFAERLGNALREQAVNAFRENYCHWDLLILDDVQFLGGRAEAQEELFHIFNMLCRANRQIVIAADKPPDALGQLQKRLVSRFASGIVANLKPPEWETRMTILEHHVKDAAVSVPKEVLSLVATRVPRDVRKMTGSLRKIVAFAALVGQDISSEVADEILNHLEAGEAA